MIYQHHAPRYRHRRIAGRDCKVGTVEVGTILYLQDGVRPLSGLSQHAPIVRRDPWIVEAWHNRRTYRRLMPANTGYASGGHLATVRSLRDGRREMIADWLLRLHDDHGLTKEI
jgi:hypothetical protein